MPELISGKRNSEFIPPPLSQGEKKLMQSACLIGHTNLHRRGRSLELLDPAIAALTVEDTEQVINCIEIALLCVQGVPVERPDREVVLSMLTMNHVRREASTILGPGVLGYHDHRMAMADFLSVEECLKMRVDEIEAQAQKEQKTANNTRVDAIE
ncbi:putative receptor-like protein kinase [Senna tora]|uniref:Putative receptor-like protein kinase n=1 Tax=Senna tora TaxID=362788 RepID=A0A834SSJ3_9FABA|nr:putative receptor-like protein kinase [Senna tora]